MKNLATFQRLPPLKISQKPEECRKSNESRLLYTQNTLEFSFGQEKIENNPNARIAARKMHQAYMIRVSFCWKNAISVF